MSKPAPPSQPKEELVEMEAMDLEEWEQDQHTPVATDEKLAELVKQSAAVPAAAPLRHTQTQTVPRVVAKSPPPSPAGPFDGPTTRNAG
ncbi:MAG: hypothetical protein H0T42_02520, partial [Deltaproteobacteria bacterium]|nr:hypothetical protein [Deltaproteobacteria bacterium]